MTDTPHPEVKRLDDAWARTESGLREPNRYSRAGDIPTRGGAEVYYALGGLMAVGFALYAVREESLLLGALGVLAGLVPVLYGVHVQRSGARYIAAKRRYLAEREALLARLSEGPAARRGGTP